MEETTPNSEVDYDRPENKGPIFVNIQKPDPKEDLGPPQNAAQRHQYSALAAGQTLRGPQEGDIAAQEIVDEQAAKEKEAAEQQQAEEEKKKKEAEEIYLSDPRYALDAGANGTNWTESPFAKEAGAGVVGGVVDAVEGVGSFAESLLTGEGFYNPEFKPTWLQVPDHVPIPENKTALGNIFRMGVSLAVPMGPIGFVGKMGGKLIPKTGKIASFINKGGRAIKANQYVPKFLKKQGRLKKVGAFAAESIVSDFITNLSLEETLNDQLVEAFPNLSFIDITTTSSDSTPMEKRAKHALESIAIPAAFIGGALGFRRGFSVVKNIDNGKLDPKELAAEVTQEINELTKKLDNMPKDVTPERLGLEQRLKTLQDEVADYMETDPVAVVAKAEGDALESHKHALNEQIQLDLFEHGLSKATPAIHPQFYSTVETGLRGTRPGNLYTHMKDMLLMASRGDYSAGRRARLVTEATIKRMARHGGELKKQLDAFAEELQKGMELPAGANVGGLKTNLDGVRQLAIAKYTDIMTSFPDLRKADFDDIRELLLEDAIQVPNIEGKTTKVMNSANAMALEMMMYDLNAAVADQAMGLQAIAGSTPIKESISSLLTKVEAAFMMNQEASEFAGSLLRARRGDSFITNAGRGLNPAKKQEQIKTFTKELGKLMESSPELTQTFLRAFAETNGEVHTMEALRRYAADSVFNWRSVLGTRGARSEFVDGLFNTLYNSILSAPKTLSRAFSGTGLLTVMRPIQIAMGGALTGDQKMMAKGLHMAFDNMHGAIGEAWKLAASTHNSLINNKAGPYVNQIISPTERAHWQSLGKIIEKDGNLGELAMYRLTSTIMDFNNNRFVRYPSNFMTTIDAFSKTLIGRQELKARAFEAAWNEGGGKVTKELLQKYESKFKDEIFNNTGEVVDLAASRAGQEVALQIPLTGKLGELESLLNRTPILRPFFLFMKTGANAISVVSKHTPILGRFNDDVRAILSASADNLDNVAKFGITNAAQLAEQKALIKGRIATGYMTVGAATGLYTTGRLTGNGPANREQRNAWIKSGKWRPRSIKLGNKWVNYDGLEPFASFLALVADIGDNASTLGEAGTEEMFRKAGYIIAMNLTNKSFLAGLQPLTDILAFDGARGQVWAANLTNNFIPWSGARNEIANVINPGLREVERDFMTTIANRNPFMRGQLPVQFDPLNGEMIRDFDFPTRMWNSISPIQITGADNPTRKTLRESGYDLATTFATDSFGNRLNPEQRSKMMELMGKEGIEDKLTKLFADPDVKKEMEHYRKLRARGIKGKDLDDPQNLRIEDAYFFEEISRIFNRAKKNAEVELFQIYPELKEAGYDTRIKRRMQGNQMIEQVEQLFYSTQNK